jgi:hypothetical protein
MSIAFSKSSAPGLRPAYRWLVFVCLIISLLLALGTSGWGRTKLTGLATPKKQQHKDVESVISSPLAHQPLALQRWQLVKQINQQYNIWPFYQSTFSYGTVLFPRGKSDKVYYLLMNGYTAIQKNGRARDAGENGVDQMACYERVGKLVVLRYAVRLQEVKQPPQDIPIHNLRDYLSTLGTVWRKSEGVGGKSVPEPQSWIFSGPISKSAEQDLGLQQEFIDYSYEVYTDLLYVSCVNPTGTQTCPLRAYDIPGIPMKDKFGEEVFATDNDFAHWGKKYGLPLADCERPAATGEKKERKAGSPRKAAETTKHQLTSAEAVALAKRITGYDQAQVARTELRQIDASAFPFGHPTKRRVWAVTLEGISLTVLTGETNDLLKSLTVLLEVNTGRLIRVDTLPPFRGKLAKLAGRQPEKFLKRRGCNVLGPAPAPPFTFAGALRVDNFPNVIANAKRVTAYLVTLDNSPYAPAPDKGSFWVIIADGFHAHVFMDTPKKAATEVMFLVPAWGNTGFSSTWFLS